MRQTKEENSVYTQIEINLACRKRRQSSKVSKIQNKIKNFYLQGSYHLRSASLNTRNSYLENRFT